jgi:hypothetical protein
VTEPDTYFRRLEPAPDVPHGLGRNVKHDARSKAFAHPATTAPDGPVDWAVHIPVLDQDRTVTFKGHTYTGTGSCTGNAGTGDEGSDTSIRIGVQADPATGAPLDEQYALQMYSDATAIDPYQGTFPPDDEGSDGLSIAKVLKARGLIDSYTHILSYDVALSAIQEGPFITGVNWYDSMFTPDADGVVSIDPGSRVAGGHEFLVVGRAMVRGSLMWKCRNSWGRSWGIGGNFYLSDATYERLLAEDGDATVLHWTTTTEPTPTPVDPAPGESGWVRLDAPVGVAVARWATRHGIPVADAPNELLRRVLHVRR